MRHYDRVTGFYRRSFTTALDRAPVHRATCLVLIEARDSADGSFHEAAISEYQRYLDRDDALFVAGAADEQAAARLDYAEQLVADGDEGDLSRYAAAYDQYLVVVEEQPDTPAAESAPDAMEAMYEDATASLDDDEPCDALEVLELFATELPGDDGLSDRIVARAEEDLPDTEDHCQRQRIEDEIADLQLDASELPPPTPVGTAPDGRVAIEIVNGSDQELELLYTGPETGRLAVGPCSDCLDPSFTTPPTCGTAGSPRQTVTLPPGPYEMVVKATGDEVVTPFYGTSILTAGTVYSECYYVQPLSF